MDVTLSDLLASFLESPLVVWVRTLGPLGPGCEDERSEERVNMFMELVDGVFLHKIMTQIDPSQTNQRLNTNVHNDASLRLHNLIVLLRHIKIYYLETLQQLIVMPLPNILCIAMDPISATSMEELKRLLLLILGCAVQCERKEEIIEKIKLLDIETQAAIVSYIQEVTHNQLNVLDFSWLDEKPGLAQEELEPLSRSMATSLRQLIDQRDKASEMIVDLTLERDYLSSLHPQDGKINNPESRNISTGIEINNGILNGPKLTKEEKQHLSVELADTKAKLRRYRQELEEKVEQLMDSKHEMENVDQELQRLKQENQALSCEARSVRLYRDEVDSLREKASRVDRLETELTRCKDKLNDVHFYKSRVKELREDNITLMETKVLLDEQLAASRGRSDKLHTMEKDNLLLQAKVQDLEMERESERQRLEELVEENMLLEIGHKQSMNESAHLGWELEQLSKSHDVATGTQKSLVHELNECVTSRVLKLEKENQELQSSIEKLKEENHQLQEQQLRTHELEREKHGSIKKLEHLQSLLDQERQTLQDMESLGEDLLKEKLILDRDMQTLRAEKDKQISTLESEKLHLSEAVMSLRERAQSNSEVRVREVEAENRSLSQNLTETGSRLASLETQLKLANEEMGKLRDRAGRCDEAEREVGRLERHRETLKREVESLQSCNKRTESLEKQLSSLEQEVHRLKREAEVAEESLHKHVAETERLSKENMDLCTSLDTQRSLSFHITNQQEEYKKLQGEMQETESRLEAVKKEALGERKKVERMEMNITALNQEKQQLEKEMHRSKSEQVEMEKERQDMQSSIEELKKGTGELSKERRRREEGDCERKKLQLELNQSEKARKHTEKESLKIRTLLEGRETEVEEKVSQLTAVKKELENLNKESERLREVAIKAKELERDNKELQKQATINKRMIATLREDLVSAKLTVQQQSVDLEALNDELEKVGLNKEKLLQQEHTLEDSKYRLLESRLDETVQKTLKHKEEKISSLERKLQESHTQNGVLLAELANMNNKVSAMHQRHEEGQLKLQKNLGDDRGQLSATAELLRIKDRLIDLEKDNSSLQTERSLLKDQVKQLENQNTALNNQIMSLQGHTTSLQEQNSVLHTQTAKLQVESSTLSSESASLMAQNAVLQGQVTALETEVESWQRQREEAWRGRENVLSDHERLLNVHERQAHEYEQLISHHTELKRKQRGLESEHKTLHGQYCSLLQQKLKWEEGQKENKDLQQEHQKNRLLQQENLQLKLEVDRSTQSQSQQSEQNEGLQQRINDLKSSYSAAQLEVNRWMSRYDTLTEQHQGLDLTMTKLDNHCELLSRLKGNLEEENHHLMSQINLLSQQNHTLLERSMESKDHYHQEQKLYIDKLNALRRQKEKLEEKIMDQYKFYEPTPKKRSLFAKLIKPRKESSRERACDPDKESGKERERTKSAPDIPLPSPPPFLPPEDPPPVPPRLGSDSQDQNGHTQNQQTSSPNPGPRGAALTPVSRGFRDKNHSLYRSRTPGGSNDCVNVEDSKEQNVLSSTPNHHMSSLGLSNVSGSKQGHRPRGFLFDEDVHDSVFGHHGNNGARPGSAEYTCNTSSSNSPVNYRDAPDCPIRSGSLSSDDALGLTQWQLKLSRSATLPYDHAPQRAQPHLSGAPKTKTRSSSPGSEMVTLEQFLQESNIKSPPMVSTGSREDLTTDYFSRGHVSQATMGTPTSFVTPTIQASNQRPGQSVKPSPRQPVGQSPASGQTVTQRANQSLSRTFSLASADLLRSNGPDGFHGREGSPVKSDVVVQRQGGSANAKERPLSARLPASTNLYTDGSYLASPIHHSSSLNLHPGREQEPAPSSYHRGEVAMVTPVRAVPTSRIDGGMEHNEGLQEVSLGGQSSLKKDEERCNLVERPKSTPASPDPNNDPQTVWYEYGCV